MIGSNREDARVSDNDLTLPSRAASMATAVYRFEEISRAITLTLHDIQRDARNISSGATLSNEHFRSKAYKLLTHYVDHGFQASFRWVLCMRGKEPKTVRITLEENPFHWGLLAMAAASEQVLSRNKLRDLGKDLHAAHAGGIQNDDLESFIKFRRLSRSPPPFDGLTEDTWE